MVEIDYYYHLLTMLLQKRNRVELESDTDSESDVQVCAAIVRKSINKLFLVATDCGRCQCQR